MEIMSVNGKEFQVIRLLGKGKGGYSYLVTDGEGEYVLKQIHHEPCSYYTFGDKVASEIRDYKRLREIDIPMPQMLDVDVEAERILKDYIQGDTVDVLVLEDRMEDDYYHQCVVRKMVSSTIYGDNLGRVPSGEETVKEYQIELDSSWNMAMTYVYALAMDEDGYVNNMQICLLDGGSADYEYKN